MDICPSFYTSEDGGQWTQWEWAEGISLKTLLTTTGNKKLIVPTVTGNLDVFSLCFGDTMDGLKWDPLNGFRDVKDRKSYVAEALERLAEADQETIPPPYIFCLPETFEGSPEAPRALAKKLGAAKPGHIIFMTPDEMAVLSYMQTVKVA
jgi:hypothetical protein